ncbi:hypothetical protein [Beggiatoa leptomitoformis]|uniref:Uncharacterized protein n=1 Tax=Beggiatoa leptomitoformis TaxID=288004 RepID=A0A2N9YH08_9GAMM|nr:hypothetical protein [Beggiatoa leptomitoformis]ALG68199.1 hypothetical protein AL038_11375 [Beggiatoa leptomitoformis]AUI69496.1 hypothetical protein BLE401_12895 [Beggiatoa leptomitoformis]
MKYLETLKQQAAQKKEQEQQVQRELTDKQSFFNQSVKPAYRKMLLYVYDLIQQLNYLNPDIKHTYHLPKDNGKFLNFKQSNYSVSVEKEEGDDFFLRFECEGSFPIILQKENERDMLLLKDYLWKHKLTFKCVEQMEKHKFSRVLFTITPLVIIEFKFTANAKTNKIDIDVVNFEELGRKEYSLPPESITGVFLDEFAKYLLREAHQVELPPRYVLPNKYRQEIKRQIQEKDIAEFDDWLNSIDGKVSAGAENQGLLKKVLGFWKK